MFAVIYENGADLNWLHIFNESKQPLVLNSGDLLAGGKQDRMIGETKIIAPGQSDYAKVYCIEKGRWDDKIKGFNYSGSANSEVKKVMDLTGRQAEVWKEIERQFAAENKPSQTWPYFQLKNMFDAEDSAYFKFFTKKFIDTDSSFAGFIAVTGNRIINTELFATNDLFRMAFPAALNRLIQQGKKGSDPLLPIKDTQRFMDNLLQSEATQKKFVATRGQINYYQGKVMHVIAYGD